jgi:hypothetical protein
MMIVMIKYISMFLITASSMSCSKKENGGNPPPKPPEEVPVSYTISMGGNAYITQKPEGVAETVTENSVGNWTNPATVFSAYFRLGKTGKLNVKVRASVPAGNSKVKISINGTPFEVSMQGSSKNVYNVGTVDISSAGYVKVDFQGLTKTGDYFADVYDVLIGGTAATSDVVYANDPENFYWSRRGPSCHLSYGPVNGDSEWFYNELTVPVGEDKIGSYFMSNGFGEGYFGIQVNSSTERRVLFSGWDPNVGKTTLVKKGPDVIHNEFGGEGTGGQSYMLFNWKAGTTYKFLTRGKPDGAGGTEYSSWIFTPENNEWRFMATWKRPNTVTYLTRFHSFLENFNPEFGFLNRKVHFGNQWVRTVDGQWQERTTATFTMDATGANKQRLDFKGGMENGKFFLQNDGFFADFTEKGTTFTRPSTNIAPDVDLSKLPQN